MLTLRSARANDLSAITAIYAHAVLTGTASYEYEAPSLAEMTARFTGITGSNFPYLVAQDEGPTGEQRVLGYAYASPFRTRPAYRFMVEDSIYIAPDSQGLGIGTLLLAELLARCEALGFRQMIAVIGDAAVNLPSARLHAIMGFTECGRIKASGFKFNRWCDTLLMQRALNGGSETPPIAS
jgi:L-amino acid N-acyltransferase YncA